MSHCLITRSQYSHGTVHRAWWSSTARIGRTATDRAWKVSIADIHTHNWSLDFKNPNGAGVAEHKTPGELVGEIEEKEKQIVACCGR